MSGVSLADLRASDFAAVRNRLADGDRGSDGPLAALRRIEVERVALVAVAQAAQAVDDAAALTECGVCVGVGPATDLQITLAALSALGGER